MMHTMSSDGCTYWCSPFRKYRICTVIILYFTIVGVLPLNLTYASSDTAHAEAAHAAGKGAHHHEGLSGDLVPALQCGQNFIHVKGFALTQLPADI